MIGRIIKHKIFFSFIFFGCLAMMQAQEINEYTLESSIKIQSIRKTTQDLLQVYREIGATPQQVAVPFVFLSFLGYPSYPAIIPDTNVSIFVFSAPHSCKKKYIFLAKLVEGSNIQKILENLGSNSQIDSGWTFFAKDKEDFQLLNDKQSFIAFANDRAENEIEITTNPAILSCTKLTEDKNLSSALKNIDKAQISINILDNQIDMKSDFIYKKEGFDFADWLVKNVNQPGIVTKILDKNKNQVKANFLLERKSLTNLCNILREHINKITTK